MSAIEMVPLGTLKRNPRNARTHSQAQIRQIAESIQSFGFQNPIMVDEQRNIIAGHGRYEAARLLGLRTVPVIVAKGLSETRCRALALADNKIAANAGWDRERLALELPELAELLVVEGVDVTITGFAAAEIDNLMLELVDPEADPADALPEVQPKPSTTRGDLWRLGKHRLLCGDARNESDVNRLMAGKLAAMVFTDPPYNVRIASVQGRGKIRHREFVEASGEMSSAEFIAFLTESLKLAARVSKDGAIHYVCMDWRHMTEMLEAGRQVYGAPKQLVIWNKSHAGQGSFYRSQHELIFVFKRGDGAHINNFGLGQHGRSRSNIWTYPGVNTFRNGRLDDLSMHPTVKPVALVADAIRDCSRRGDIVVDSFLGSGTTILAAERIGRAGYGLELDPLYVDVAIRRWETFTGRDAIHDETGLTFADIAEGRKAQATR
jgi:DNA modification methylase